jgi:TonB family protein
VKPGYTAAAMDAHIEGTVSLDIVVLADGKVGDVTVTASLDKEHRRARNDVTLK